MGTRSSSSGILFVMALVFSTSACATGRASDTRRRTDPQTAVVATQKAGLPSHLNEGDPDNVERRFGHGAERARRDERARQKADQRARVDVADPPMPATVGGR